MKHGLRILARLIPIAGAAAVFLGGSLLPDDPEAGARAENVPTVEMVLKRYIDAAGGREALERLSTRLSTGIMITDLTSRQEPILEKYWFTAHAKSPSCYLLEIWTDHGIEKTGFDGTAGWKQDKCGAQPDESAERSKLAYFLNPQGPLYIPDYFPGLKYAGREMLAGKQADVLEPAGRPAAHYRLYFDVTSGLLARIGYYWDIQDYRRVDGVLLPHRISASRKGGSTTWEFNEIRHNIEISDSIFTMPENAG
jgi:hypothetical protein